MTKATEAHCRRVAALAVELARVLNTQLNPAEDLALRHHDGALYSPNVGDVGANSASDLARLSLAVGSAAIPQPDPLVAAIVEAAHAFEQGLEFAPYESRS